jgi:hypothetical protein
MIPMTVPRPITSAPVNPVTVPAKVPNQPASAGAGAGAALQQLRTSCPAFSAVTSRQLDGTPAACGSGRAVWACRVGRSGRTGEGEAEGSNSGRFNYQTKFFVKSFLVAVTWKGDSNAAIDDPEPILY